MAGFGAVISELAIRISADSASAGQAFDDLSKKITEVEKTFSAIGPATSSVLTGSGSMSDAFSSLTAGVFSFNETVDSGMAIVSQYSKALGTIATVAGVVIDPILDIATSIAQMTLAGGAITEVAVGFENLTKNAGISSSELIKGVSAATDHLYTFTEIMQSTANAVSSGFGQNQIVTLYEFGSKVSDVTNRFGDARQIAETMTQAIISGNERVLKQFDIIIRDGASVTEVFEQIKAKMASFGEGGFNLSDKFDAIGVQITNIVEAFSKGLNLSFQDSGLGGVLDNIIRKIQEMTPFVEDLGRLFSPVALAIGEVGRVIWEMGSTAFQVIDSIRAMITEASWTEIIKGGIVAIGNSLYSMVDFLGFIFNFATSGFRFVGELIAKVAEGIAYIAGWDEGVQRFQKLGETIEKTAFSSENLIKSQSRFTDAVTTTGKAAETTATGLDRMYKRNIDSANDMTEKIGKAEEALGLKIRDINERTSEKIADIEQKRVQAKQDLSEKLQKIEIDRLSKITEAENTFSQKISTSQRSFDSEKMKIAADASQKLTDLSRNFQRDREQSETDHSRRMASIAQDYEDRRRAITRSGESNRMTMIEDYDTAIARLAKEQAKAKLEAQKSGNRDMSEIDREFNGRRAEINDDFQRNVRKSLADQQQQERDAEEAHRKQASEAATQYSNQRAEAERKHNEDRAQIILESNLRQAELEQKHATEIQKLKQELAEKISDISKKSHDDSLEAEKAYQKKLKDLQREESEAYAKSRQDIVKAEESAARKRNEIYQKYWAELNSGSISDSAAREIVANEESLERQKQKIKANLNSDLQEIGAKKNQLGGEQCSKAGSAMEILIKFEKTGDPILDAIIDLLNKAARADGGMRAGV